MKKSIGSILITLVCITMILSGCGGTSDSSPKIVGEIIEWGPLGQLSPNFTGIFGGVEFKLKEIPDKIFQVVTDSFEEAARFGVMEKNANGVYIFLDLTGWKVEIAYEENEDGTYRVTSLKRLSP